MKLLTREQVSICLLASPPSILDVVQRAYRAHADGHTDLPHSVFLRPPTSDQRFIALPAYLGGTAPIAGMKWISSFPANVQRGLQRASSVMILNDLRTGYPSAILESSGISAHRTAASAALASCRLHDGHQVRSIGLIGCGTINLATEAYLTTVHPTIEQLLVFDVVPGRATACADQLQALRPNVAVEVARSVEELVAASQTVSIATTDSSHWLELPEPTQRQVVLHLSLRDLSVDSILRATNVVDDLDHVVRERTSIHLAAQRTGSTAFVTAEIGDLLNDADRRLGGDRLVFSPFGLGILDLAVADQVLTVADLLGLGTDLAGFDPGEHRTSTAVPSPART